MSVIRTLGAAEQTPEPAAKRRGTETRMSIDLIRLIGCSGYSGTSGAWGVSVASGMLISVYDRLLYQPMSSELDVTRGIYK